MGGEEERGRETGGKREKRVRGRESEREREKGGAREGERVGMSCVHRKEAWLLDACGQREVGGGRERGRARKQR
jgi:hypothetical protein